jgi:hypothetical protein
MKVVFSVQKKMTILFLMDFMMKLNKEILKEVNISISNSLFFNYSLEVILSSEEIEIEKIKLKQLEIKKLKLKNERNMNKQNIFNGGIQRRTIEDKENINNNLPRSNSNLRNSNMKNFETNYNTKSSNMKIFKQASKSPIKEKFENVNIKYKNISPNRLISNKNSITSSIKSNYNTNINFQKSHIKDVTSNSPIRQSNSQIKKTPQKLFSESNLKKTQDPKIGKFEIKFPKKNENIYLSNCLSIKKAFSNTSNCFTNFKVQNLNQSKCIEIKNIDLQNEKSKDISNKIQNLKKFPTIKKIQVNRNFHNQKISYIETFEEILNQN